jgi:hypothetical protein
MNLKIMLLSLDIFYFPPPSHILFSVITNKYNKKTKGPTLMELFKATGKLKKIFITRDVRCVHHGWHDTHRYDIQVLATPASTWVYRYSYTHSHRLAAGKLTTLKNNFLEKKIQVVPSTCTGFVSTCPTVFVIPRVHYETPCTFGL